MLEVEDFSQRGDAPALAIIQDNARKKAIRQVVETQEELTRIHDAGAVIENYTVLVSLARPEDKEMLFENLNHFPLE